MVNRNPKEPSALFPAEVPKIQQNRMTPSANLLAAGLIVNSSADSIKQQDIGSAAVCGRAFNSVTCREYCRLHGQQHGLPGVGRCPTSQDFNAHSMAW